jgi:hypothetical protein
MSKVEDGRLEDVDAGVGEVAARLLGPGLLLEGAHAARLVGHHDPVGGDLLPLDALADDRREGPRAPVVVESGAEIEVDDGVTAEDDEGGVEEAGVLLDAGEPAGAPHRGVHQGPVVGQLPLEGVGDLHPEAGPVAEVVLDLGGLVGRVHHDLLDPVLAEQVDQVLHDRSPEHGDHGLGHQVRQGPHPGSLAGGQDHRFHRISSLRVSSEAPRPPGGRKLRRPCRVGPNGHIHTKHYPSIPCG